MRAMQRIAILAIFALAACSTAPALAQSVCPPVGYDRATLEALKASDFETADPYEREAFALAITACLASPDPALRDGIAFEALSHMLRARQLGVSTQTALVNDLLPRLTKDDPLGFERPFAALALSELVRSERLNAHFTDAMRADVLGRSIAYFTAIRDYRGFDQTEGWRHGVAHGADLLLQLALNESFGRDDLLRVRDAVAVQLAPEGHFYIYGEPERLMRPILFVARRGIITEAEWSVWFASIAAPRNDAFTTQAGLAWRNNLNGFLSALYLNARLSDNVDDDALLPGAEAALRAMP